MAKSQGEMSGLFKKLEGVATQLHLDVADGKAVPGTSLDFPLRLSSKYSYNAHLMIKKPEKWIEKYGHRMKVCTPQVEEISDIVEYISWMKEKNQKIGFALKPETPYSIIKPFMDDIDVVLILTVHPGFYGAKYLKSPLKKVRQIRKDYPNIEIIVDGGMNPATIKDAFEAGASSVVSGSYISKSDNPKKAMMNLKKVCSK